MINSVAGNSNAGFLPQAGLYTMLEVDKTFDNTATPQPMGTSELPQVVKFNRELLALAKNDVKSGNYYPGKYLNILA